MLKNTFARSESHSASRDSLVHEIRRRGVKTVAIPESAVTLTIPADSLRKLPAGAVYRGKSGRANLSIGSDSEGNIVAEASCDSLQQLVLWYEEELTRMQTEASERKMNDVRTEKKRGMRPLAVFAIGAAAGIIMMLIIKIKKRV